MIQNPAISSFASVNGPSVTTRLPSDTRMRVRFEDLPNLALAVASHVEEVFGQLNGFFLGVCPKDREPADHLLGFSERPIRHGELAIRAAHACAQGAGEAAFGGEQPAGLHSLFDQLPHFGHFLLCRRNASLRRLVNAEEFHSDLSLWF